MPCKDLVKRKEYHKNYYVKHKQINAYHKRLNYWRNKAIKLGEANNEIILMTVNELKALCKSHIN